MLTVEHRPDRTRAIAGAFFSATLLYYAWLLFYFFPHTQLGKYSDAARLYHLGKLDAARLIDFSPLYFYLHLLVPNSIAIYWIHILAVAASAAILFLLFARFFSLTASLAGAILFITDRSINVYAQVFEPEMLLILFSLLFVFFIYGKKRWEVFAAGLAFGLTLLCRPVFLPVAFAIPWILKSQQRDNWKRASLWFAMPVLVCIGAIWIRNAIVLDHFSPSLMNPGTVFYEGNNPNSHGQSSIYPPLVNAAARDFQNVPDAQHEVYRLLARRISGKQLSISEVNAFWTRKALSYLKDHPARLVYLLRLKLFHAFHGYLWHDLASARNNEMRLRQAAIPAFPFAGISAMCLIGIFLLRGRFRELLVFYLMFFCLLAVMLVFYVSARQHAAFVFLFLFFACGTIEFLLQSNSWKALLIGAVIVVLGLLFYPETDLMREEDHLWEGSGRSSRFITSALNLRQEGKLKEALQYALMSAAAAPWNLEARKLSGLPALDETQFASRAAAMVPTNLLSEQFDSAVLMLKGGGTDQARQVITELIRNKFQPKRDFYQSSALLYYLSKTNAAKRIELLRQALEQSPGDPWILADLYSLTSQNSYREMLFRYFDEVDAHWFLAKSALACSCNTKQAIISASYVTSRLPEYRNGWIELAAGFSQAGRWNEATQSYRHAIAMRSDPVLYDREILAAFQHVAEKEKNGAFAAYSYGFVLRQFGYFSEALSVQMQALSLDPKNPQIQSEVDSLKKEAASMQR